ncbi:MAG: NYN domain-containing protein [Rhodoferax sp.]
MNSHDLTKLKMPTVAFLIDADNLSAAGIEEAFQHLQEAGATVQVRRAYGGIEKLLGLKDVLRRHAIQGLLNQGKGTTDVALVVDAMDLLHRGGLPSTVAIGSSDADFAPLAVRLREAGLLVICFAQKLISSDALGLAYEKVIFVDTKVDAAKLEDVKLPDLPKNEPVQPVQPVQPVLRPAVVLVPIGNPKVPTAAHSPAEKERSNGASIKVAVPMPAKTSLSEDGSADVHRILAELPAWLPNTVRQLNQLGAPLVKSGIKKGNKPLHELFRKYPAYFKVLPMTGAPKQVRLLKKPGR